MIRAAVLTCTLLVLPGCVFAQKPAASKICDIAFVRIKSSDFQKASETYAKILGLPTGGRDAKNGCTNVKTPCYLVNSAQHVELVPGHAGDPGSWLQEIGFSTDSVRSMREYLMSLGIKVSEIKSGPNGTAVVEATDPGGNRIAFVEAAKTGELQPSPHQVSSRIFHAGFVVKNLDPMKHFYVDQLGFRLYWKGGFKDLAPGAIEKNSDIDWYAIQVPNGSDWIEFMLNIPANADHQELGVQNHFCLGVPNMEKALDQLHKNGLAADSKYADDKSEVGRDGKWQFDIFDPDWTRIEFMEPTPVTAPCCHPFYAPHPTL